MRIICVSVTRLLGRVVAGVAVLLLPLSSYAQEGALYLNGAFSGEPASGGGTYGIFEEVVIGGERQVVFGGEVFPVSPSMGSIRRVWDGELTASSLLARDLQPAPGTGGDFLDFSGLAANSLGQGAFLARTTESTGKSFLFAKDASGVVLGLSDQTAPFAAGTLQFKAAGNPAYSSNGVLAVKTELIDPENTLSSSSSILIGRPGNLEFALTEGDPLPDGGQFPSGAMVGSLYSGPLDSFGPGSDLAMNDAGQLVFVGEAVRDDIEYQRSVIFSGSPGNLRALAIEGEMVPGESAAYLSFAPDPAISSTGVAAFVAEAYDSSSMTSQQFLLALFAGTPGNVTRLVSDGDLAPGGGDGVILTKLSSPAINSRGDVVFQAEIEYPNFETRSSLWLKRAGEAPVLLAAVGNVFSTPTGPAAVTGVKFAGQGAFNDLNQAAFVLQLANGQGIYVADTRSGYPVVRITSPGRRAEQVVTRNSTTIAGTASDATGVDRVEYRVTARGQAKKKKNGETRRRARRVIRGTTSVAADGGWAFSAPLLTGRNMISVLAVDQLGNESPATEFIVIRWAGRQSATRGEYRRLKRRVQIPQ